MDPVFSLVDLLDRPYEIDAANDQVGHPKDDKDNPHPGKTPPYFQTAMKHDRKLLKEKVEFLYDKTEGDQPDSSPYPGKESSLCGHVNARIYDFLGGHGFPPANVFEVGHEPECYHKNQYYSRPGKQAVDLRKKNGIIGSR